MVSVYVCLRAALKERRDLALENLALRQQLAVLKQSQRRLKIKQQDRVFWIWLSRTWTGWRAALIIIKPTTVGRLLLSASLAFFRSRGVPRVALLTAERNEAAQRLFASMGFRRTMIEMTRELDDLAP